MAAEGREEERITALPPSHKPNLVRASSKKKSTERACPVYPKRKACRRKSSHPSRQMSSSPLEASLNDEQSGGTGCTGDRIDDADDGDSNRCRIHPRPRKLDNNSNASDNTTTTNDNNNNNNSPPDISSCHVQGRCASLSSPGLGISAIAVNFLLQPANRPTISSVTSPQLTPPRTSCSDTQRTRSARTSVNPPTPPAAEKEETKAPTHNIVHVSGASALETDAGATTAATTAATSAGCWSSLSRLFYAKRAEWRPRSEDDARTRADAEARIVISPRGQSHHTDHNIIFAAWDSLSIT